MISSKDQMSKDQIEATLWKFSNLLRGLVDPLDSRNYILGLLLLKKLSENSSDKIIDWEDVEASSFNIGKKLNEALYRYEQKYNYTKGQFKELDFDSDHIGSQNVRDKIWKEIISNLSKINLTSFAKSSPSVLCELVLWINERFFPLEIDKGFFEIPLHVIRLLSEILVTQEGTTIYDPYVSSGTTLIGPACLMKKIHPDINISTFCQTPISKNLLTLYLNLSLTDNTNAEIALGDIIRNPGFFEGQHLITFQKILSTIPSGIRNWGEDIAQDDPYFRFIYGVPPRTQGEYAYLQHCIASLSEDGILAVIIPPSMLFRERSEGDIRRRIINRDIIEAVISLPPKIYPQTSIPFAVLVINRKKAEDHKEKILFINAMNDYCSGRSQNTLRDDDVNKILAAFKEFKSIEGYSRVCSLDEIAKNNFLLNVSQYVIQKREIAPELDLDVAMKELDSVHSEKNAAYKEMQANLRKIMGLQE
jgi:type I restriction enzyme M protein